MTLRRALAALLLVFSGAIAIRYIQTKAEEDAKTTSDLAAAGAAASDMGVRHPPIIKHNSH